MNNPINLSCGNCFALGFGLALGAGISAMGIILVMKIKPEDARDSFVSLMGATKAWVPIIK